jgi:5-formyltetrahydrofolate cyclo-ligase
LTNNILPAITDRRALRRELRARRRAIQGPARELAARNLARLIAAAGLLRPGRRIALYLAMPEEIDTLPLLQIARQRGCFIATPRITSIRHNRIRFHDLEGAVQRRRAREFDVVFMPLVGFDARGNRIGMGRGFYDRCFAHRIRLRQWRRPLLVGLAYDQQQVTSLSAAKHDVPVDIIVTQSSLRRIRRSDP